LFRWLKRREEDGLGGKREVGRKEGREGGREGGRAGGRKEAYLG